jgi:hypothetical protein
LDIYSILAGQLPIAYCLRKIASGQRSGGGNKLRNNPRFQGSSPGLAARILVKRVFKAAAFGISRTIATGVG